MKIKTSELEDELLDLMVAKCENEYIDEYSTSWEQGGPIIEREKIELNLFGSGWMATLTKGPAVSEEVGPTPLVAAMRCYVASKLGDEVELTEEV